MGITVQIHNKHHPKFCWGQTQSMLWLRRKLKLHGHKSSLLLEAWAWTHLKECWNHYLGFSYYNICHKGTYCLRILAARPMESLPKSDLVANPEPSSTADTHCPIQSWTGLLAEAYCRSRRHVHSCCLQYLKSSISSHFGSASTNCRQFLLHPLHQVRQWQGGWRETLRWEKPGGKGRNGEQGGCRRVWIWK